ncbi:hypothetical protein Ahy_A05g025304 [Arachis hypogaea]|uniref:Aminotransferase-like plant mobile domain-containing protein n=1 Tax=Arachis hypogaea TaxID=3818 RepID=A0A445D7Z8_ARAHY|nr:hypothetical protein Ahy_A05g025304 [Arachis hypogaea]
MIDENSIPSVRQYSLGLACLAHLYRALCRASCFDCKKIGGPLTLMLAWAWIRLSYLAPFVWVAYGVDRIEPDIIPADIYMHSVVWSTTNDEGSPVRDDDNQEQEPQSPPPSPPPPQEQP